MDAAYCYDIVPQLGTNDFIKDYFIRAYSTDYLIFDNDNLYVSIYHY